MNELAILLAGLSCGATIGTAACAIVHHRSFKRNPQMWARIIAAYQREQDERAAGVRR